MPSTVSQLMQEKESAFNTRKKGGNGIITETSELWEKRERGREGGRTSQRINRGIHSALNDSQIILDERSLEGSPSRSCLCFLLLFMLLCRRRLDMKACRTFCDSWSFFLTILYCLSCHSAPSSLILCYFITEACLILILRDCLSFCHIIFLESDWSWRWRRSNSLHSLNWKKQLLSITGTKDCMTMSLMTMTIEARSCSLLCFLFSC